MDSYQVVPTRYAASLQWSQVNEELDSTFFDYQNLGLPEGTGVYKIKGNNAELVDLIQGSGTVASDLNDTLGSRLKWMTAFVLLFSLGFGVYLRLSKSRTSNSG
jgi:hypothetical protein